MAKKELKNIFGSMTLPLIDFGLDDIPQKAIEMAGKTSISGVQPKLLVSLNKQENILSRDDDGEYILKPQILGPVPFPNVPENEQCCMDIAEEIGIEVPPHCLLPLKDKSLAYVVKRFDRKNGEKINQEDFFQALEKQEKYDGSVEQIGKKLKEISAVPGLDVQLFYERVVFNFLVGNGDAHFKNYSIYYLNDREIRLTPAYDIVCSRLVAKDDESALTINGKKNKLARKDFDALADKFNIPQKVRYEKFEKKFNLMQNIITASEIKKEEQDKFIDIVSERLDRLQILK